MGHHGIGALWWPGGGGYGGLVSGTPTARATAAVVEATAELATAALAAADPRLVENAGAAAAGDRCDCVGHSISVLNEVADGLRSRSAAPSSTSD